MTSLTPKHSTSRGSHERRERAIAAAQRMLRDMPPFERSNFAAGCLGGSAQHIQAARARYDRHVSELQRQTTDPAPRSVATNRNGVVFSW
jgi:hypothetical protein